MQIVIHDDVIKWNHFPRYWPFVRIIHRSLVNNPQWCEALIFSFIFAWTNGWVHKRDAVELRRQRTHFDGTVMSTKVSVWFRWVMECCVLNNGCQIYRKLSVQKQKNDHERVYLPVRNCDSIKYIPNNRTISLAKGNIYWNPYTVVKSLLFTSIPINNRQIYASG